MPAAEELSPDEQAALRAQCSVFLAGHGQVTAADMLASIPASSAYACWSRPLELALAAEDVSAAFARRGNVGRACRVSQSHAQSGWQSLTPSERAGGDLVAEGLSNLRSASWPMPATSVPPHAEGVVDQGRGAPAPRPGGHIRPLCSRPLTRQSGSPSRSPLRRCASR